MSPTPTPEAAGLVDTSVFIAREGERPLGQLPGRVAVSVVTIGELQLGVLSAQDATARARRGDTLALAKAADPIPISESVMGAWARLVADCRRAGIQETVKVADALITATAIDLGLPVVTQDDDYDQMARAHRELRVLKV
jgi:predicted nucleic acid-binding protein